MSCCRSGLTKVLAGEIPVAAIGVDPPCTCPAGIAAGSEAVPDGDSGPWLYHVPAANAPTSNKPTFAKPAEDPLTKGATRAPLEPKPAPAPEPALKPAPKPAAEAKTGTLEIAGKAAVVQSDPLIDSYRRKLSMALF